MLTSRREVSARTARQVSRASVPWAASTVKNTAFGVARTFQHINLADELTALDNIAIARTTREQASLWRSILTLGLDPRLQRARRTAMGAAQMLGIAEIAMSACEFSCPLSKADSSA